MFVYLFVFLEFWVLVVFVFVFVFCFLGKVEEFTLVGVFPFFLLFFSTSYDWWSF